MGTAALTAAGPGVRARAENFPVALRLLPARHRADLMRVYDVLRAIDDAGDDACRTAEERLADLDGLAEDLQALFADGPVRTPVVERLRPTVLAHGLTAEPFLAVVDANRL